MDLISCLLKKTNGPLAKVSELSHDSIFLKNCVALWCSSVYNVDRSLEIYVCLLFAKCLEKWH